MSIQAGRPRLGAEEAADWNIAPIVAELRTLREESLASRSRSGKPIKLPSRKVLSGIIEGLSAALFPNRLSSRELALESVDYYVGRVLDIALRELIDQVELELQFVSGQAAVSSQQRQQAVSIVHQFADALPAVRRLLESDIHAAYAADPTARTLDEVLACYPGFKAITYYRLAHVLHGFSVLRSPRGLSLKSLIA